MSIQWWRKGQPLVTIPVAVCFPGLHTASSAPILNTIPFGKWLPFSLWTTASLFRIFGPVPWTQSLLVAIFPWRPQGLLIPHLCPGQCLRIFVRIAHAAHDFDSRVFSFCFLMNVYFWDFSRKNSELSVFQFFGEFVYFWTFPGKSFQFLPFGEFVSF